MYMYICIHYNLLHIHTLHMVHIYNPYFIHVCYVWVHVATMHPVHVVLNRDDTDNFKR